jgi:hypothetical protein
LLIVVGMGWATVARLRSPTPVVRDWFQYVRSFLVAPVIVAGALWLALSGGPDGSMAARAVGALVAGAGLVILFADVRDFRLWRAETRRRR